MRRIGTTDGLFLNGNPATGVQGTIVTAEWLNSQQEEVANTVTASGQTLDPNSNTQLLEAIRRLAGGHATTVTAGTTNLTAAHAGLVVIDATAGNVILNLPAANTLAALEYDFVRVDTGANTVTINRAGTDTIDEAFTAFTLAGQGDARTLMSNGATKWLSRSRARGNALLPYAVAPATSAEHAARFEQVVDPMTNVIIGGDFSINQWQRGTSLTGLTSGTHYLADRFALNLSGSGSGTWTFERSTDVPNVALLGRHCTYSLRATCTTADATVGTTDVVNIHHAVEGYNYLPLYQQQAQTVSFSVKSNKPGIYSIALRNGGLDRSYIAEITINAADTWELKTVTLSAVPAGGTWNFTNGVGLHLSMALVCGSTYKTAPGAWANGNYMASSNQSTNVADAVNNYMAIADVRLHRGSTPLLALPSRSVQQEFALCQRYFEKIGGAAPSDIYINGYMTAASGIAFPIAYNTTKRSLPTVTKLGSWNVTNCGQPIINGGGQSLTVLVITATATGQLSAATVDGTTYLTSDAEL